MVNQIGWTAVAIRPGQSVKWLLLNDVIHADVDSDQLH